MLSKSRGHVLRLAAVMKTLFSSFTNDADSGVNGTEDSSADFNIIQK